MLPADLKDWDFEKKKKRKRILPDITTIFLFLESLEITEKIKISKHHSASVNYVKNMINRGHVIFFSCDRRSEKTQLV